MAKQNGQNPSSILQNTTSKTKKSLNMPKRCIRIRKSKKDRHHNSQKKQGSKLTNVKWTNNDLQSTTQKTEY